MEEPKLSLEEGAFERKVYQLIHEYSLSYERVRNVLDLTRGREN